MQHIVAKWGRNDEKYWIGNLKDQTESMQITQNLFPIWAQALLHNHNPEVALDHPPATKAFVWIKKHTPKIDELNGNPPDTTNDVEPPKSPSALPNNPLADYPRDFSPLPEKPLKDLEKGPSPAPPPPSSDIEVVQRSGNQEDTSYDSPIALKSSQASSPDGTPSHKYARSPSDARSPTGELIGDAIRRLSVQRGERGHRVPSVSPICKRPGSRGSLTPQPTRIISAAGRAVTWPEFLEHCSFASTDMAARGLIQLNHIPHWSFFLTTSVQSLMKMIFPFPEATAQQFMYGTNTMPPKYFESN
jgi:hypothetical protein